jgi:uncharacterized protein
MERVLYNGLLSGVSLAGDRFFYTNPLASAGGVEREAYFEVACCPANLARTLARLPRLLYAVAGDEIAVTLYAANEAELATAAGPVRLVEETDYPWRGDVRLALYPRAAASGTSAGRLLDPRPPGGIDLTLALRLPGWARQRPLPSDLYRFLGLAAPPPALRLGGREIALTPGRHALPGAEVTVAGGFARVRRTWRPGDALDLSLPMPPRRVVANPKVAADADRVALQRGPLVYALEGIDHDGTVAALVLPATAPLTATWRADLLGGVMTIEVQGERAGRGGAGAGGPGEGEGTAAPPSPPTPVRLQAIPYFAWANRGAGEMEVWVAAGWPSRGRSAGKGQDGHSVHQGRPVTPRQGVAHPPPDSRVSS